MAVTPVHDPSVQIRPKVRLADPTGVDPGIRPLDLASRPTTLKGARLGLLDNSKMNSDVILHGIARILNEEFEFADIFYTRKHSGAMPPRPEVLTELHRNADVVITGIGD